MRAEDAVYGGEMSAHHSFRDFAYCDSGMIPWLLITERICSSGVTQAQMVEQRIAAYPCSGEINVMMAEAVAVVQRLHGRYATAAADGPSVEFVEWRTNVRSSKAEPLLRLNVETQGNADLLAAKTAEYRVAYHRIALGCLRHPQGQCLPMEPCWANHEDISSGG